MSFLYWLLWMSLKWYVMNWEKGSECIYEKWFKEQKTGQKNLCLFSELKPKRTSGSCTWSLVCNNDLSWDILLPIKMNISATKEKEKKKKEIRKYSQTLKITIVRVVLFTKPFKIPQKWILILARSWMMQHL